MNALSNGITHYLKIFGTENGKGGKFRTLATKANKSRLILFIMQAAE
jgi:hypothetical protein